MFNQASDAVADLPGNQTLDSFQVVAADPTTMYLFYLTQADTVKVGVFGYDDVVASNGNHTYTYFGSDPVGANWKCRCRYIVIF